MTLLTNIFYLTIGYLLSTIRLQKYALTIIHHKQEITIQYQKGLYINIGKNPYPSSSNQAIPKE